MNSKKRQQFGIKFPFTNEGEENYFIDTNMTLKDKVRSLIMHVIFTPKGQKLRDPNFGTNLIKYIFEPNEKSSWDKIKEEIGNTLSDHVKGISLDNIEVIQSDEEVSAIYCKVQYSISNGITSTSDSIAIKL